MIFADLGEDAHLGAFPTGKNMGPSPTRFVPVRLSAGPSPATAHGPPRGLPTFSPAPPAVPRLSSDASGRGVITPALPRVTPSMMTRQAPRFSTTTQARPSLSTRPPAQTVAPSPTTPTFVPVYVPMPAHAAPIAVSAGVVLPSTREALEPTPAGKPSRAIWWVVGGIGAIAAIALVVTLSK